MPVDPVLGLHSLGTLARALSISTPLEPLFERAAEEALLAIHAASVSIGRLDPDGRSVRILVNVGDLALTEDRFPEDETYSVAQWGVMNQVMTTGVTQVACLDSGSCDPSEAELLRTLGKRSSVSAAIRVDGSIWGEFYATRHLGRQPFNTDAIDYVDVLTAIVGAAIGRSLRESELADLAFHDALTGALNRHGLNQAAAHIFDVDGTSRVVSTVALDINGLKQVNDQQGHARGDELIEAVGRDLDEAFAFLPGSLVARVGGDEFIVLVPDHDPTLVAETVDALFRRTTHRWRCFGPLAGLSAGVSSTLLTGHADVTRADLLAAADRALYLAKHDSASTVVVSEELTAVVAPRS